MRKYFINILLWGLLVSLMLFMCQCQSGSTKLSQEIEKQADTTVPKENRSIDKVTAGSLIIAFHALFIDFDQ